MRLAVIIPAAGSSARYIEAGGLRAKLDEDLGGRPVLHRTIELFSNRDEVSAIIVAGPADEVAMEAFKERHAAKLGFYGVRLCTGGISHRWETVRNALEHVPEDCTHVGVHDGARPCAPGELIGRVLEAARDHDAVIPAIEVADTIKRVSDERVEARADPLDAILGADSRQRSVGWLVSETLDRRGLVAVQTPQVFRTDLLRRAYAQDDLSSADDATLVERLGEAVLVVEGDPRNIKITVPGDLSLARAILGVKPPAQRATHKRF